MMLKARFPFHPPSLLLLLVLLASNANGHDLHKSPHFPSSLELFFNNTQDFLAKLSVNSANGHDFFRSLSALSSPELFTSRTQEFLTKAASSRMSATCTVHLGEYMQSLTSFQMWALAMFDAGGKINSGLLEGNILALGNYGQCLKIEANSSVGSIRGKYCLAMMNPLLVFATCLPSSCSYNDMQELYQEVIGLPFQIVEQTCYSEDNPLELDDAATGAVSFFGVILGLMVLSTVYDVILHYSKKKSIHPVTTAFSVFTNGKQLFKLNSEGQITCLHGLRSITLLWVIIVHQYAPSQFYPYINMFETEQVKSHERYMLLHGASPAVDTFLAMGGLVISYSFIRAQKKGFKFNVVLHYVHRYLRLTPLYAAVILFQATLVPYTGNGPMYLMYNQDGILSCQDYWWSSLLYIQNFVNPDNICILPSWYLSVDMQLFLLSPLFLIPLVRWPKITFATCGVLVVLMSIGGFLAIWIDEVYALWDANSSDAEALSAFVSHYYYMPHIRATPWIAGLILGYFFADMHLNKKQYKLNIFLVLLTWVVCLVTLVAVVYGPYDFMKGTYDRTENAIYALFVRVAWSFVITWVMFACATGYGGIINWFLSLPLFEFTSRLVYGAYLVHSLVIRMITGSVRAHDYFSDFNMVFRFCGLLFVCVGLAIALSLAFEYPMITIEKSLLGRFQKRVTPKPELRSEPKKPEEIQTKPNDFKVETVEHETKSDDVKVDIDQSKSDDIKVDEDQSKSNGFQPKLDDNETKSINAKVDEETKSDEIKVDVDQAKSDDDKV